VLEANGFVVAAAADGPSGIRTIENGPFDLTICDLFLPKVNGLEALKVIRNRSSRKTCSRQLLAATA
jgi:CheY-like chemotaxis protein